MMYFTEQDIHDVVGRCVVRLLEMEEPVEAPQEKGLGYSIDTFVSEKQMKGHEGYVIPAITAHLMELKTMCLKNDIDFEWSIVREEGDRAVKRGWRITATAAMPELKVPGYKYVGSVVPLTPDYALVAPSKEFKENFEVLDRIKGTVAREKCAGCGRAAERGIYYVFQEEQTGELKKFGSNCAKKYLGISVDASINKVFTYLANALGHFDFGSEEFWGGGSYEPRGSYIVEAACAYLAIFGIPEARFSFKYCKEYEELMYYYRSRNNKDRYIPKFAKDIENNYVKIGDYLASFYSGAYDFFKNFVPQSDFDESVKQNGLYLGGIHVTKGAERFFREGIFPYAVLKYFQGKRDEGIEVKAVDEFYGVQQFTVEILNKVQKHSLEGGTYFQFYGKTENNEYIAWSSNQDNDELAVRRTVTVAGEYDGTNGKYCMLRRAKIMGLNAQDQQAVEYPADGTRFKDAAFKVVKGASGYVVLRGEAGDEYFVSNTRKDRWGEVTGFIVDEWEQVFKPGNVLKLTGTVDSYTDRYGELKHTLKRVVWDQSSFPEIDYSGLSFRQLLVDKKKIIVNGKAMDIRQSWDDHGVGKALVEFPTGPDYNGGTYAIYDFNNQTISKIYDDWDEAKEAYRTELKFGKYLKDRSSMMNDNVVLVKDQVGKTELLNYAMWPRTSVRACPELEPYSGVGDCFLVFTDVGSGFGYYNMETMQWAGQQINFPENFFIAYQEKLKGNGEEFDKMMAEIKSSFDKASNTLNTADMQQMVTEVLRHLFR